MNILGLIFGILLICACTFSLSMHKFLLSRPVEITCQNHLAATRKILNAYESEYYKALRSKTKKEESKKSDPKHPAQGLKKEEKKAPLLNGECSRLNLRPLIQDGKDEHPILYETAARMLRSLYQKPLFGEEVRLEYQLLDAILSAAKCEGTSPMPPLEKLLLPEKNVKRLYPLQMIYYRMLKGTKPAAKKKYPCLADYFSIEDAPSSLCLRHASIEMLSGLFNPKAALQLVKEMQKNKDSLSKDRILEICIQSGITSLDDDFFELIDLKTARHRLPSKKILVEEEGGVSLRKQFFMPGKLTLQSEARS